MLRFLPVICLSQSLHSLLVEELLRNQLGFGRDTCVSDHITMRPRIPSDIHHDRERECRILKLARSRLKAKRK